MSEYVLYVLAGLIVLLIAFLLLRLILQLVFIRQCPDCGRTVSLIKTKECPRCGHDFRSQSDPKFRLTVVLFVAAILGMKPKQKKCKRRKSRPKKREQQKCRFRRRLLSSDKKSACLIPQTGAYVLFYCFFNRICFNSSNTAGFKILI